MLNSEQMVIQVYSKINQSYFDPILYTTSSRSIRNVLFISGVLIIHWGMPLIREIWLYACPHSNIPADHRMRSELVSGPTPGQNPLGHKPPSSSVVGLNLRVKGGFRPSVVFPGGYVLGGFCPRGFSPTTD